MNVDWPRWIKASVSDHFVTMLDGILVDGQRRGASQTNDRFELRFDGPDISQKSKGEYWLGFAVNLLIISASNENDIYQLDRYKGAGAAAFSTAIPVFRYGPGANDDQSLVGCVTLKTDLNIRDFGSKGDKVYHVAIDAYYVFEPVENFAVYQEALVFGVESDLEAID